MCEAKHATILSFVMPGLVPGIHALLASKTWMAGTSPAMTLIGIATTTRRSPHIFRYASTTACPSAPARFSQSAVSCSPIFLKPDSSAGLGFCTFMPFLAISS